MGKGEIQFIPFNRPENVTNIFMKNKTVIGVLGLLTVAIVAIFFFGNRSVEKRNIFVLGEDFSNTHALEHFQKEDEAKLGIKLEFVKNTFDAFDQKASQDLANGTGLYDIILHYSSVLSTYGRNKWVYTLDEQKAQLPNGDYSFEKDIFPEVWRDSSFFRLQPGQEPTALGYPFCGNTMVLVYNRTLFDDPTRKAAYSQKFGAELKPPTTWEEFKRVAEFLTANDGSSRGVVLQGASGSPLYWEWCNFAFGMGGGVMKKKYGWEGDTNTPMLLDSPETITATAFYVSLKPFNAADFFSTGQAEQQELMRTKKIGMAIMWSDSLFALVSSPQGRDFGFAPIPGDRSMIGGGTFYLNHRSKVPKDAFRYIVKSMQKDSQVNLMTRGLTSALRSAYDAPEVKQLPYADAVRRSLDRGVYMLEAGPDSGVIRDVIEQTVQRIWKGEVTTEAGLKTAQKEIVEKRKSIFEKYAK